MKYNILSENKTPVYCEANPHLHMVNLSLYIRCGAMYENEADNGITHFYEHIIFRNIDKMLDGKLYHLLDRHGVDFNATTYKEFMRLYFSFLPEEINFVLDLFGKMFNEIILSPEEINLERDVIKAEIYEESVKTTIEYASSCEIWKDTSLSQTILGSCTSINHINKKKLNNFREDLFSSGDMFVCITGNATEDTAKQIADVLSNSNISFAKQKRYNIATVPNAFCNRSSKLIVINQDYSRVQLCFDFSKSELKAAEIMLIYDYLFKGDSCRFYDELTNKRGLIYSYDAILEEYNNIGNIRVQFDVKQSNIEASLAEIVKILVEIKNGNIDLTNQKALCKRNALCLLDEIDNLNWERGYYDFVRNGDYKIDDYMNASPNRIAEIAKGLFTSDRLIVTIKGKKPKIDVEKINAILHGLN